MGVIVNGSRTDFRSDRLEATTCTKPFGKSKCHYTGGIYFDKIQSQGRIRALADGWLVFGIIRQEGQRMREIVGIAAVALSLVAGATETMRLSGTVEAFPAADAVTLPADKKGVTAVSTSLISFAPRRSSSS